MNMILVACLLGLVAINLVGLALYTRRYIENYTIAKAVGILAICLPLFFIEHFVGLGSFHWLWPITTAASCWKLYKERIIFAQQLWKAELVFLLGFLYAALWRIIYPDIRPSSENIPDAYYIANYLQGTQLPPMDYWWPHRFFNFYYAFQHYCAALMGRMFNFNAGQCYNIAFCIISGGIISLAWTFVSTFLKSKWLQSLVMVAFVFGGTGVTPILMVPAFDDKIHTEEYIGAGLNMIASNRFSGNYDLRLTNPTVREFFNLDSLEGQRKLTVERFSYLFQVRDYHPPLSGIFLLMLCLACIAQLEKDKNNRLLQFVLVTTGPISIAANIWSFPLQVGLIVGWIAYRYIKKEPLDWVMLIGGGAISLAAIYPYLLTLASHSTNTEIKWVQDIDRTPLNKFIAQHWPIVMLMLLGIFNKKSRSLTLALSLIFTGLFLFTELFWSNDLLEGVYQRANSTMKWWSWVWDGTTVALGTLLLASQQKFIKNTTIIILLSLSLYLYEVVIYLNMSVERIITHRKSWEPTLFQFSGDGVRARDPGYKDMIAYLKNAPEGIILENQLKPTVTWNVAMGIFTQNPTMLGWPGHITGYRGPSATYAWRTYDMVRNFYDGKKPDAASWLKYQNVKYIIWSVQDDKVKDAFNNINNTINKDYYWFPFYRDATNQAGIWIRK